MNNNVDSHGLNLRLALKVFHNVQKAVIYVRMITELHFDLIEIGQSVLQKIKSVSWLMNIALHCIRIQERGNSGNRADSHSELVADLGQGWLAQASVKGLVQEEALAP